jgi:hypothetical protein
VCYRQSSFERVHYDQAALQVEQLSSQLALPIQAALKKYYDQPVIAMAPYVMIRR